jgi:hypothetical protein
VDTDLDRMLLIWPSVKGRDVSVSVKGENLSIIVKLAPLEYECIIIYNNKI